MPPVWPADAPPGPSAEPITEYSTHTPTDHQQSAPPDAKPQLGADRPQSNRTVSILRASRCAYQVAGRGEGWEMRFGLLGPLMVESTAGTVPLTSPKGRLLLGALLLRANETVPTHGLLDALWGDAVPPTARASLQNHVARLRGLFGPAEQERIRTTPSGYLIRVEPGELDLEEFQRRAER